MKYLRILIWFLRVLSLNSFPLNLLDHKFQNLLTEFGLDGCGCFCLEIEKEEGFGFFEKSINRWGLICLFIIAVVLRTLKFLLELRVIRSVTIEMAGMTRMDIGFFFIILLISVVHTNARNVFVFRSTGELTFLENGLIEKSTILDTVSEGEALALEKFPLDLFCNSCLEASRKVEKFLTDPSFLDKIGAICTDVCNLLPSDSQVKCLEMSEKYIHQTVLYLQEYFSESNLCHSTGLCPESTGFVVPDTIEENQASNERSCTTCRNAVKELLDDLEDPETKIKVIKVLLKACENVDGHVKECKKMVFDYGPLILANLGKYLSNNDVCYIVHVCDAAAYHVDENTKLIELPVDGHLTAQPAKMIM